MTGTTAPGSAVGPIEAFDAYTRRLVAWARDDARVLGVVLLGSGAERERIDAWSDHDIAVLATPGSVDELREDPAWLPDSAEIVAVAREWHDGFTALFADGRVLEFAVTDPAGFESFPVTRAAIVYDTGVVTPALDAARLATRLRVVAGAETAAVVLLVELLVGVGRVRRGEALSGGDVIRSEAALTLIDLLIVRTPGAAHPDGFDGRRRIEAVLPRESARLAEVLAREPEAAARGILDLAEEFLAPGWPGWPSEAVRAVRRRLGWMVAQGE
ncbi:hypothetical protein ACFVU2_02675 [Leifsonia sp. NPDC058194]|uniref:hypothetical protein n=1 Tax=Leifsonia sp. NPDC058194 TaxID=3346374 RepID=UPI0036DF2855